MIIRHSRVVCLILLLAGLQGGCSAYRDPQISMNRVAMLERTGEAVSANVLLDLANPNDEPLELLEVNYSVRVNGKVVSSLRRSAQATLAAKGARQIEIPIVIPFHQLEWTADQIPEQTAFTVRGNVQYVTPGEIAQILFDTGVRKPRAGFEAEGALALR
jgi:LEA14-like dessication related protein